MHSSLMYFLQFEGVEDNSDAAYKCTISKDQDILHLLMLATKRTVSMLFLSLEMSEGLDAKGGLNSEVRNVSLTRHL